MSIEAKLYTVLCANLLFFSWGFTMTLFQRQRDVLLWFWIYRLFTFFYCFTENTCGWALLCKKRKKNNWMSLWNTKQWSKNCLQTQLLCEKEEEVWPWFHCPTEIMMERRTSWRDLSTWSLGLRYKIKGISYLKVISETPCNTE